MDMWETMVGGAAQYAAMQPSKYLTLDFLSDAAKKSILWACANAIVDINGDDAKMPHPKYLINFAIPVQYELRNDHGLAGVLSNNWVIQFSSEFIAMFIEGIWNRVYQDNEWFDKRKAEEKRYTEIRENRKVVELQKARKLLENEDA
jgi:hypothetical protein